MKNLEKLNTRDTRGMGVFIIFLCFFSSFSFAGMQMEPWGKDSDITRNTCHESPVKECSTPLLGAFAEAGIWFHQEIISPADGPRSHFFPSSSQYTLEAMRRYGFFRGFVLGCDRLMRENPDPWVYKTIFLPNGEEIKYNPVPFL